MIKFMQFALMEFLMVMAAIYQTYTPESSACHIYLVGGILGCMTYLNRRSK